MVLSADGRGRTLLQMLLGLNKKDMTPLEFQYRNPLKARVGSTISFDHDEDLKNINFVVEKILVYKTETVSSGRRKSFYHTDYCLKGVSIDLDKPLRYRLRLEPDDDANNELRCKLQLLKIYHEESYNPELVEYLNKPAYWSAGADTSGPPEDYCFCINQDDDGNNLEEPQRFWRIDGFDSNGALALDCPYEARVTVLKDEDGDGQVEDEELQHFDALYWDFSRLTGPADSEYTEYLIAEMNKATRSISMLRGNDIHASCVFTF